MVKLIGAVMTGFSCVYFGFRQRNRMKCRVRSLGEICTSLENLESEIDFGANKLGKAFLRIDINGLFKAAALNITDMGSKKAWEKAVNSTTERLCLTDADAEILLMLGNNLGKTDTEDQLKNIRYIKNLLLSQKEQAYEEYSRKGKLYSTGGVLVGLMVIIILL